jgi:triosephosphate isomerase (TIM)
MTIKRTPILAANWKMHKSIAESIDFVTQLKREVDSVSDVDIVLCPSYTALSSVSEVLGESNIQLGAQDLYWEPKGAFTGEVAASQLKDAGCAFTIIGHSERRQIFGETNNAVSKKIKAALGAGLLPIVCVGETLGEREAGQTQAVVAKQFTEGFEGITKQEFEKIVIAYEPVWAIGTGRTATSAQAQEVHSYIRQLAKDKYKEASAGLRIQYGGSVKPNNIAELMAQPDVDGALVGGASLEVGSFVQILNYKKAVKF